MTSKIINLKNRAVLTGDETKESFSLAGTRRIITVLTGVEDYMAACQGKSAAEIRAYCSPRLSMANVDWEKIAGALKL